LVRKFDLILNDRKLKFGVGRPQAAEREGGFEDREAKMQSAQECP